MQAASAVIRTRLDLVLHLIDTTTGNPPTDAAVRFYRRDGLLKAMDKGEGSFVFIDLGREDFLMRIEVTGYDALDLEICYEKLDEALPVMDVFLMPSENAYRGGRVISFTGKLPKLTAIEAVKPDNPVCTISDYDEEKQKIMLFLPSRRISMESVHYGIVYEEPAPPVFEHFEVEETVLPVAVRIKAPLKREFMLNSPICRVVFGRVDAKGNFVLRVRDNSSSLKYLVRYIVDGQEGFMEVDFHALEGVKLKRLPRSGAAKAPRMDAEDPDEKGGN